MAYVISIDTEPETVNALRAEGHTVDLGDFGYRTGRQNLFAPPHESDLLICDLRRPACFNATNWGPNGLNDNFRCKIEKSINNDMYRDTNGQLRPVYELIKPSHIGKGPPGTFGPNDIFKAIDQGGVPMLIFLNPEWMRHIAYSSPNFFEIFWRFERTKATKLELTPVFKDAFPEGQDYIKLALPLEFHITETRASSGKQFSNFALVKNVISQVFGEVILLERGCIWALPQFTDNAEVCKIILKRLDSFVKFQSSILGFEEIESRQLQDAGPDIRDIFISYASEDRDEIARPLAEALIKKDITVWFDEYELTLGDNLRRKIEEGLKNSRFGITILSHHFFTKRWPQIELDGLFALEAGSKKILPVWHKISERDIREYSPVLAGRLGISTSKGLEAIVEAVQKAIKK